MKLNAEIIGNGPKTPLVFLHSFPQNAKMWAELQEKLSDDRQTIALDFPGYGKTPPSPTGMTVKSVAEDIIETLRSLEINSAIFIGCSMGGYVIFELIRRNPELVAGLILCDTRAEADSEEARDNRLKQIEKIQNDGTDFMVEATPKNLLSDHTRETNPALVEQIKLWTATPEDTTIIKTLEMLAQRPDSVETLKEITVPALILVGENDKVTPVSAAETIAHGITDSKLKIIPRAGHLSPVEEPAEVLIHIKQFINTFNY